MDSPPVPAVPDTIHVLLVDDEQLSRFVVGNLLRKCNYAVTVVDSGASALDLLSRSAPGTFQLILTDLMMPEVDGLDILRYVRTNTLLEDLPVIMMSANEQKDTVFQAIKGGAEEYLVKPVTKKEVQNIWQHVWKRLKATQLAAEAMPAQQQQQQQAPTQANGVQPGPQQQQQQTAASAAVAAATAAAGAAAALHRGGSSRGMRHLQQQQKLLQQQHTHNQLQQQRQQQGQPQPQQQQQPPTAQQQELLASMQQLHQAQQPSVFQPDRRPSSNMHSQILLGQLLPKQQQQQPAVSVQLAVSLQQQQQANQEDFESLTFFLNTLHGQRAAEAAAVRATVSDLDTQIAEVQAALQELQPQQEQGGGGQPGLCGGGLLPGTALVGPDRPGSAGIMGESLPPVQAAAAATAAAVVAAAAAGDAAAATADGKRQLHEQGGSEEDEDDLEMERRERSRRHKRQRVMAPAQQQQQQLGGEAAADAGALLQLQLARQGSTTGGTGSGGLQLQPGVGSAGAVAAADCGSGGGADPVAAATAAAVAGAAAAGVSAEILSKWQHVSGKFDTLQTIYLRQKQAWSASQQQQQQQGPEPGAQPAAAAASKATDGAAVVGSSGSGWAQPLPGYLSGFGDDLWGYSRYSRLVVRGTVRAAADLLGGGSAMVCAAACDRDDEYVATAGVSKRIRIFEYDTITSGACGGGGCLAGGGGRPVCAFGGSSSSLSGSEGGGGSGGAGGACWGGGGGGAAAQDARVVYPVLELSSRSRLSCVAWSPYVKAQLASSDYEGVVQLWDANTGSELMQLEEHSKRAWAVDFSRLEPTRLVSSSDDGTVKLWSIHQEASVGTLNLHANVCSVQFSPDSPHLLAAGCANYRFYLYDLRNTSQPLVCVPGHRRSVSYVRWLDGQQLVTASTDNTLRRWAVPDLLAAASSGGAGATREIGGAAAAAACRMTYRGHTNNRNFIGLAVLPGAPGGSGGGSGDGCGGYIVCGSETNEAYVYHSSVPLPVASHSFQSLSVPWGQRQQKGKKGSCSDLGALAELADAGGAGGKGDMFVSCVAWNRRHGTLVAANSAGHIQVLELA